MAQLMNDSQRIATLEAFNPKEHLITVGKDRSGKATMYYPAAWRLYELNLRYPNANFKSEIIYHNEEKGTVIVKAYLYLGSNYGDSDKKAEAMKQGSITSLDKVETAAKARAARDFGIGTEYALDMVPDETDATHDVEESHRSNISAVSSNKSRQNGASVSRQNEQENKPMTLAERRRAAYDRALELGQFQKGATKEKSLEAFLAFVAPIVSANVANIEQLTASRLDAIEAYLNAKDAA